MSAFMVSNSHINYLVTFARDRGMDFTVNGMRYDPTTDAGAQALATLLRKANHDSVCARYPDDPDQMAPITFRPFCGKHGFTLAQVAKASACFDYQACEVDGYFGSDVAGIMADIRDQVCRMLPGYADAEWEIDA